MVPHCPYLDGPKLIVEKNIRILIGLRRRIRILTDNVIFTKIINVAGQILPRKPKYMIFNYQFSYRLLNRATGYHADFGALNFFTLGHIDMSFIEWCHLV